MKKTAFCFYYYKKSRAMAKIQKSGYPKIPDYRFSGIFILILTALINTNSAYAQIMVPSNVDFGNVEVNDSLSTRVTVSNIGTENVTITGITGPAAPFSLNSLPTLPVVIAPADSETFDVTFAPSDSGVFNATFTITSDEESNPILDISLTGTGFALNPADSGACYASTAYVDSSSLIRIDPSTGEGTLIGITGLDAVPGLAINSAGKIYGTDDRGNLYRIDAVTGTAVFISDPNIGPLSGMAFDSNDTLYVIAGYRFPFDPNLLYTVDPTSGTSNFIGETRVSLNGLSFDPTTGTLWGSGYNSVYTIDKLTGMPTLVGYTNLDYETTDLHFDIAGNLYATAGGVYEGTSYFVSIDKTSGEGSIIGETGFQSVSGLAFYNVPIEGKHISVVPSNIDFGITEVGNSRSATVTFSNIGTESLEISDISDPGMPFSLANLPTLPVVIAPANAETFTVMFTSPDTGVFNGTITITSDDENNPALEISLNGTAIILNPADSGACYASTAIADSSSLIKIDPTTGTGTLIGNTGLDFLQNLAINSHGKVYGSDNSGKIFGIDAVTGVSSFILNPRLGRLEGMAFDDNDSLYVMSYQNLYIVDPGSGFAHFIGNTGISVTGLSFNPVDGTLWASASNSVYTINVSTGSATSVPVNYLESRITGLDFDVAGNLYAITANNDNKNKLVSINKTSGEVFVIGETGFMSGGDLAFYAVPMAGKHIRVIPTNVDFGYVKIDDSKLTHIVISSIGTDDLTVCCMEGPEAPFVLNSDSQLPLVLQTGNSQTFMLGFTIADAGKFVSTITIINDGINDPALDVSVYVEGVTGLADSGIFYASNDRNEFLRINPLTGKGTLIGSTEPYNLSGLAIDSTGKIYGSDWIGDILRVYNYTAEAIFLFRPGIHAIPGIAFDKNNVLYASPVWVGLFRIDLSSGTSNYIELTGDPGAYFKGLAFNPMDGVLWASDGPSIFTVDTLTKKQTLVGDINLGYYYRAWGLEFDATGNLFATIVDIRDNASYFAAINKTSGEASIIGDIGFQRVGGLTFHPKTIVTGIADLDNGIPKVFALKQNYPNPFNPFTTIQYDLASLSKVSIIIYDILGREVTKLIDGKEKAGHYEIMWDGKNKNGTQAASGIYFYRMVAERLEGKNKYVMTRKLLLLK